MIIRKIGFSQNNQADHIFFDKQAKQTAVSKTNCCHIINETINALFNKSCNS